MRWAVLFAALLASGALAAEQAPSNQALVFYNARMSLREKRPTDVLHLWLLRNGLSQRGEAGVHDAEFRSVVWAALAKLGMCQDGFPKDDEGGAGLWPLALHNWLAMALSKGPPPATSSPWEVFAVGRQQRHISLHDVLSAEELRSVTFFRTDCHLPRLLMMERGESPLVDLEDRLVVGTMMRELLVRSQATLVRAKVPSRAVVDARIFDLNLALAELASRKARREARSQAQQARALGVSAAGAADLQKAKAAWPENSSQARFLRRSLGWTADEWLSLNRQRRLSLFSQARPLAQDPTAYERLVASVIDALIERRDGDELSSWIGFLDATASPGRRALVTSGERGKRLLELEDSTGFRERAVVALHRGVAFLEAGELQDALRSFAYALHHAETSREAEVTAALARRWLSFTLSRFETSQQIIDTLKALVPRQEYNAVVEDLLWRAALRADLRSFTRVVASRQRGGAFDARVERLRPLAEGNPGEFATGLRSSLKEEPHAVLRFCRELLENLESEDGAVRRTHVPTLKLLLGVLGPLAAEKGDRRNAHARTAEGLIDRTQSILDGLEQLDVSPEGQARSMSLGRETFAGSIRLAPADPLPWPFVLPAPEAPSAFAPLELVPVEWRDEKGALVFGWRITE